jgi:hypothetical protein
LLLVSIVALALAIVFTWPMAERFGKAGRLENGDARFSIWNVSWVAHALTSDPANLWNANIFYPHQAALSYSEANLVAGAIGVPVWALTHNPYATSNFTILMAFVLAAVAMYALVRYLTSSVWGAALSALVYAFCSYAYAHMGHIQLLMTFGPPLVLLRLHKFVDKPAVANAVWLGLALFVEALACGYYGLYGGLMVAGGIIWFGACSGAWRSPRFWLLTALAAIVAVGLVAPFLAPYAELQRSGFTRPPDEFQRFSATWRDYFVSALVAFRWMLPAIDRWGGWHEVLFPGGLTIAFAIVAIVHVVRRSARLAVSGQVVAFYGALALFAFWGSLGPDAGLYKWVLQTVPFMTMLRASARLGLLVTLALAVFAGIGLALVERRWTGRRRMVWLTAIASVGIVTASVGPLQLPDAEPETRAVTALRRLPRGPVAEFPFFSQRKDFSHHTIYMVESASHWLPLINGYSDFVPPDLVAGISDLVQFPSPDALRVLRDRRARYVLVHWNLYPPQEREAVRARLDALQDVLRPMLRDPNVSLFELMPDAPAGR